MIIELELGALLLMQSFSLAVQLGQLLGRADHVCEPAPVAEAAPAAAAAHGVEIVKRVGDRWQSIGHRHAEHVDVHEALRTPGLALRHADGRIEEGQQCL